MRKVRLHRFGFALSLLVGLTVLGLILASRGAASSGVSQPKTLAAVKGGVYALAQDGGRIAWVDCHGAVIWDRGRTVQLRNFSYCGPALSWIALAGKRVLWAEDLGGNNREVYVYTGSLSRTKPVHVGAVYRAGDGDGDLFGGIAGRGKTLAYTKQPITRIDEIGLSGDCYSQPLICRWLTGKGKTKLVSPTGAVSTRAGGGIAISVSGSAIGVIKSVDYSRCPCSLTPAWSPDGASIALAGGWDSPGTSIFVESADGSVIRRITTHNNTIDAEPAWSPDGARIAFVRTKVPGAYNASLQIDVIGADGTGEKKLGSGWDPAWSPDSSRIAFSRGDGIYLMAPDGSGVQRLVGGSQSSFYSPSWSPDGSQIAFVRSGRVQIIPSSGGTARLASTDTGILGVRWSNRPDRLLIWNETDVSLLDLSSGISRKIATGISPAPAPDGRLALVVDQGRSLKITDASGKKLASLPSPRPAISHSRVELRRIHGGSLVASFPTRGDARALAVSKSLAAVASAGAKHYRVEIYSLPSGQLLYSRALSSRPYHDLVPFISISGSRVVVNDKRAIRLIDARSGRSRLLVRAGAAVYGLSIEGKRVVWAETPSELPADKTTGLVRQIVVNSTSR